MVILNLLDNLMHSLHTTGLATAQQNQLETVRSDLPGAQMTSRDLKEQSSRTFNRIGPEQHHVWHIYDSGNCAAMFCRNTARYMNMVDSYYWKIIGYGLPVKMISMVENHGHLDYEITSTSLKQSPITHLDINLALKTVWSSWCAIEGACVRFSTLVTRRSELIGDRMNG